MAATTSPRRRHGRPAGRSSRLTRQRTRAAWLFLAPMLMCWRLVAGWPLVRTIWFAFTDANLTDLRPPSSSAWPTSSIC